MSDFWFNFAVVAFYGTSIFGGAAAMGVGPTYWPERWYGWALGIFGVLLTFVWVAAATSGLEWRVAR